MVRKYHKLCKAANFQVPQFHVCAYYKLALPNDPLIPPSVQWADIELYAYVTAESTCEYANQANVQYYSHIMDFISKAGCKLAIVKLNQTINE